MLILNFGGNVKEPISSTYFKTPYVDIKRLLLSSNYDKMSNFKTPYVDIKPNKINAFLFTKMKLY